jgi:hypothetical protein
MICLGKMCIGNLALQKKSECCLTTTTKNEIKVYLKFNKNAHSVYTATMLFI